jgi:hypothetical protein
MGAAKGFEYRGLDEDADALQQMARLTANYNERGVKRSGRPD